MPRFWQLVFNPLVSADLMPRVYLLRQVDGRRYYIGVGNPQMRLQQHNGVRSGGAMRTSNGRPWALVLEVHGFANRREALQFEYRLQHPSQGYELRGHSARGDYTLRGQVRGATRRRAAQDVPSPEQVARRALCARRVRRRALWRRAQR